MLKQGWAKWEHQNPIRRGDVFFADIFYVGRFKSCAMVEVIKRIGEDRWIVYDDYTKKEYILEESQIVDVLYDEDYIKRHMPKKSQ